MASTFREVMLTSTQHYEELNSTSTNNITIQRPLFVELILTMTLTVIISISIMGNVTVLLAFSKSPELREQISSVFTVNLAITDIGCASTVMPFSLISVWFDDWIFGKFACGLVCFLNYCFIIVSMWTLALISIDRHLYCIYPFRYQEIMSHRRALFLTVLSWCLGFLFGSLPSFLNVVKYDHPEIICAVDWEDDPVKVLTFTVSAFVICFMTPMIVMLYCYHGLYRVAHRHAKQMQERCGGGQGGRDSPISEFADNTMQYIGNVPVDTSERRKRNEKARQRRTSNNSKAIRSICIMFTAYLICNTPFSLTKLLKCVFSDNNVVPFYINTAASWIAFTNPCCNPVIYSIYREDFKTAVRKIFPSIFSRKSSMQVRPFENKKIGEVRTIVASSEMNINVTPSESSSHSKAPVGSLNISEYNGQQPMIIITPPLHVQHV